MSNYLHYDSGQIATIVLETYSDGYDHGNVVAVIESVSTWEGNKLVPLQGYPAPMFKLGANNIYVARFQIPQSNVEKTYLLVVRWNDNQNIIRKTVYVLEVKSKLKFYNKTGNASGI